MKGVRLVAKLGDLKFNLGIDLVVFEAARNAAPKMQGALVHQAKLQGCIELWCCQNSVNYRGYSPTEIKKHATGKGNANKDAVIAAAKIKWQDFSGDDNEADAKWLLDLV